MFLVVSFMGMTSLAYGDRMTECHNARLAHTSPTPCPFFPLYLSYTYYILVTRLVGIFYLLIYLFKVGVKYRRIVGYNLYVLYTHSIVILCI